MKTVLISMLLFTGIAGAQKHVNVCTPAPTDFKYPKSPQVFVAAPLRMAALKGRVLGPGGTKIKGPILVEIVQATNDEKRIVGCFADRNGMFDLGKRNKGRYNLKISMDGWDTTFVLVTLGKNNKKDFVLEMRPST